MSVRVRLAATVAATGAVLALAGAAPSSASALEADSALSAAQVAAGQCPYGGSHPELEFDWGDNYSAAVKHAQCLWNVNNANSGGKTRISVDGYFGADTRGAIYAIQTACGIDNDGIIGPNTWKCLHLDQSPNPAFLGYGTWPLGRP